ncbi:MAG: hypothetical protein IKT40_11990 [Bacilli bacterium]|nr:hypothetical protein [Bacilli bacterium]
MTFFEKYKIIFNRYLKNTYENYFEYSFILEDGVFSCLPHMVMHAITYDEKAKYDRKLCNRFKEFFIEHFLDEYVKDLMYFLSLHSKKVILKQDVKYAILDSRVNYFVVSKITDGGNDISRRELMKLFYNTEIK